VRFSFARNAGGLALPALLVAASIVTVLVVVGIAALLPKQTAAIVPSGATGGASDSGSATAPRASGPGSGGSTKPGAPVGTRPRVSGSASTAARSTRTPTPPPATSPPPTGTGHYPAWQANHGYAAGDRVSYAGRDYQCLQAHTSQVGWEPPNTPALWRALT
jgi:hypothetical protein